MISCSTDPRLCHYSTLLRPPFIISSVFWVLSFHPGSPPASPRQRAAHHSGRETLDPRRNEAYHQTLPTPCRPFLSGRQSCSFQATCHLSRDFHGSPPCVIPSLGPFSVLQSIWLRGSSRLRLPLASGHR